MSGTGSVSPSVALSTVGAESWPRIDAVAASRARRRGRRVRMGSLQSTTKRVQILNHSTSALVPTKEQHEG
jgi:hypothetical protein